MKNLIIIIISLPILSLSSSAQNKLSSLGVVFDKKVEALHVVDGLKLRSISDYLKFDLRISEIIKIDTLEKFEAIQKYDSIGKNGVVEILTNKPIILNGRILYCSPERTNVLLRIKSSEIKEILRLKRKALLKKYHIDEQSGAIEINTQ